VSAVRDLPKVRAAFRDWPTLALKGFLWKHFRLPRSEIEIESRGGTAIAAPLVPNVGALYTALDVFAFGAYECDWDLEDDPIVVDIGANIGAWVLWLAEQRPQMTGTCYEPDPVAASYLSRNLVRNGLQERVVVRSEAVSDRSGIASLFQAKPGDGTSSLYPVSHAAQFERETNVPTVSFSEAMQRIDGEVSLVKIDCEGAEYSIVNRTPIDAWKRVKRVVVEYHPAPSERIHALRTRLVELGFIVIKERRRAVAEGTLWLARGPNRSGRDDFT
jgi:FkbM family methyltransferase